MNTLKKILVSDDDDIIRMLVVDCLESNEWIIEEAEDGKQALEKLQNAVYDLLVIDYMMPYYSGIDVLQNLPEDRKSSMPIIMLTAKSQKEDIELATSAGVTHFVQKPFSPTSLAELVSSILSK